jgi:ferritin
MKSTALFLLTLFLPILGFSESGAIDKKLEQQSLLNSKVLEALNNQMNMEFQASYMYLGMSAYFDTLNLDGFSNWCTNQSKEEWDHGMKIFNFILDRGGVVKLGNIQSNSNKYSSPLVAMQTALNSERKVTNSINQLYSLSQSENQYDALVFLQWYITEQVEEENTVSRMAEKLEDIINPSHGMIHLMDNELKNK